MLITWILYGTAIWALTTVLNESIFKDKIASRAIAWMLTVMIFFVNLVALTALQYLASQVISASIDIRFSPRSPVDITGALLFSWLFFFNLRKSRRNNFIDLQTSTARDKNRFSTSAPASLPSPGLHERLANEIDSLPSGRLGGITCLGMCFIALVMVLMLSILTSPDLPNRTYKIVGSALWCVISGYFSYWFYSGKADPRFGMVRLSLSMTAVSGITATSVGFDEGMGSWKAIFLIFATLFFSFCSWCAHKKTHQSVEARENIRQRISQF